MSYSGIPAHGTRPPFAKGNLAPVTSGYRSPRIFGELARLLLAGLLEDRPDLAAYPEAAAAWATAEAQAALLRRHLDEVGVLDEEGKPRDGSLRWLMSLESAATRHRATLGLDPRSEAQLHKERAEAATLSVDLHRLAERGREALAQRDEPEPPDLVGEVLTRALTKDRAEREEATRAWNARPLDASDASTDENENDDQEDQT